MVTQAHTLHHSSSPPPHLLLTSSPPPPHFLLTSYSLYPRTDTLETATWLLAILQLLKTVPSLIILVIVFDKNFTYILCEFYMSTILGLQTQLKGWGQPDDPWKN